MQREFPLHVAFPLVAHVRLPRASPAPSRTAGAELRWWAWVPLRWIVINYHQAELSRRSCADLGISHSSVTWEWLEDLKHRVEAGVNGRGGCSRPQRRARTPLNASFICLDLVVSGLFSEHFRILSASRWRGKAWSRRDAASSEDGVQMSPLGAIREQPDAVGKKACAWGKGCTI